MSSAQTVRLARHFEQLVDELSFAGCDVMQLWLGECRYGKRESAGKDSICGLRQIRLDVEQRSNEIETTLQVACVERAPDFHEDRLNFIDVDWLLRPARYVAGRSLIPSISLRVRHVGYPV